MTFWGVQVSLDKTAVYVPPPEQAKLRLSQATLSLNAAAGEKVALMCKVGTDEVLLCSLREGALETTNLDLVLDSYTEFSLAPKNKQSKASLHLAGYLIPEEEGSMEDDEDDEEGLPQDVSQLTPEQLQAYMDGEDSEDDSEEDYDDESDSDEDTELGRTSSVVIEDITDQEAAQDAAGKVKVAAINSGKGKNLKVKPTKGIDTEQQTAEATAEEEDASSEEEDVDKSSENTEEDEEIPDLGQKQQEQTMKAITKKRKSQEAANEAIAEIAKPTTEEKPKKARVNTSIAAKEAVPSTAEKPMKGKKTFPNGFVIENVAMGDPAGKLAKAGKKVLVKYVGKLQKTGKVFDQTKGSKPFAFRLGVNEVIKGWDQGVVGMRVGDKRKLTIPPQMAYGPKGIPNVIPGNSTLLFDVELVDVK